MSLFPAWHVATDTFPGSYDLGLCSRAYLAFEDETEAMMRVLQALEDALPRGPVPPVPGPDAHRSFPSILLEALDQKCSGLVLGEQTISWLYHAYQGHLAGIEAIDPAEGAAQRKRLQEFEAWLRERDDHPHARWHRMIRVHNEGESSRGVESFAQLWREFEGSEESSLPSPAN